MGAALHRFFLGWRFNGHLHGLWGRGPPSRGVCFGGFANIISIDFHWRAGDFLFFPLLVTIKRRKKGVVVYEGHIEWTVFVSCCYLYCLFFSSSFCFLLLACLAGNCC